MREAVFEEDAQSPSSMHKDAVSAEPQFLVDVEGFEGPLDVLLELARRQKVDLAKISVLALVEQYLSFIEAARKIRLDLAADYLVMAAWLAYLKSRFLLPNLPAQSEDELPAEELAAALTERLQHLSAIREAGSLLLARPQLGQDVFPRGQAQEPASEKHQAPKIEVGLFDLLSAYARQRQIAALSKVTLKARPVFTLADARAALELLVGRLPDWQALEPFVLQWAVEPALRRSVRASSFAACLELVREGVLRLRQDEAFAPIWIGAAAANPQARQ